jgi:hypothetical protein
MKRRDFVKALPVLGISPLILCHSKPEPVHLIALGTTARRWVGEYASELNVDTITIINDVRPKSMAVSYEFFPFNPPKSAYVYFGNCRIPKREPFPEIQLSEPILERLGSLRGRIIVFAALGKVTGTGLYKAIAKQLRTNLSGKYFLGTLPFEFEGSCLRHESKKAVALVDGFHHQKVLDLEVLRKQYRNLPITTAFKKVDEWLLEEFMEIKFQV